MIWLLVVILVLARAAFVFGRMALGLRRSAQMLKTAPKQTGTFEIGSANHPTLRLEVLGDSIAAASGISQFEQSFGGYAAEELSRSHHVELANHAVVGLRMAGLAQTKLDATSDLSLVIIGANDVLRLTPVKSYRRSFEAFLANNPNRRLIITGPGEPSVIRFFPIWLRAYFGHREKIFGRIMTEVAERHPTVSYIDPQTRLSRVDWSEDGYIGADKFHPGPKGQRVWFEVIRQALTQSVPTKK